jgi:hypothetical protein
MTSYVTLVRVDEPKLGELEIKLKCAVNDGSHLDLKIFILSVQIYSNYRIPFFILK